MRRLFIWLSGAVPEVLEDCPTEERKFAVTGGVVLVAATLAVLSMGVTLYEFLHLSPVLAVVLALGWGAAIMTFDRWLLMSIRRQRTWWLTVGMAIPRLLLAVVVGLVVAKPLVLRAFQSEVTRQVSIDKGEQLSVDRTRLKNEYQPIETLTNEKKDLQEALESNHGKEAPTDNPRYRALTSELENLEHQEHVAQKRATCELEGRCGTGKVGAGKVFNDKNGIAESISDKVAEVREQRNALERELAGKESAALADKYKFSRKRLAVINPQLKKLESEQHKREAKYVKDTEAKPGLLDRIEALDRLTKHSSALASLATLLWLLILTVDTLPAFVKTMMSLGRPSLYEQVLNEVEDDAREAVADAHQANAEARKIIASAAVDAADARRQLEVEAREELTARAVEVQKKVAGLYIDEWERTMVPRATEWAEDWVARSTQPPHAGGERFVGGSGSSAFRGTAQAAPGAPWRNADKTMPWWRFRPPR